MSRRRQPFRAEEAPGDAKIETQERLQKVLAAAGLGSRRDCEELITQGRVEVDREVVAELGTKVDPTRHEIRVDGVVLHRPKPLYYAVNKPAGVVTTNFDPSGRSRVIDLVPTEERVFPVGRLDRASEGLILVTNDGELANRLTHPRYGVDKTYHVRVEGSPTNEELLKLRRGVRIAEGVARVNSVRVKGRHKNVTDLEIVLSEGKNREIRRILAKIGHKVLSLARVAVGPVKLGELRTGMCRKLMPQEIEALFEAARQRRKEGKRKKGATREAQQPAAKAPVIRTPPAPSPSAAPPKIDLATLLNPALAPKRAMAVSPSPPAALGPAIGDVISDAGDEGSLTPLSTPAKKRRRPLREYETDSEPIQELGEQRPAERPAQRRPPERGDRKGGKREDGDQRPEGRFAKGGRRSKKHVPRGMRTGVGKSASGKPGAGKPGRTKFGAGEGRPGKVARGKRGGSKFGSVRPGSGAGGKGGKRPGKKFGKRRGK